MKILVADTLDGRRLAPLVQAGHEVMVEPTLTTADLPHHLDGVEVLVVRSTRVDGPAIEAGGSLGLIVRAGAGTDSIDTAAASARGVYVCNVPGRNAVAVAELTMGLLLAIDRRIPDNVADLRQEVWNKGRYSQADGILGSTLALVGLGEIGLAVAERAKAFGMRIAAVRRDGRSAEVRARIRSIGIRLVDSLDELVAEADVLSIHVPKAASTNRLVDADLLAKLRPGAIVLNTSRPEVIDHDALLDALDDGRVRVGLDVWPQEPAGNAGSYSSALASHPEVVGTHHIGASTRQAQDSIAQGAVEVIQAYTLGQVKHCVNLNRDAVGTSCLTVRHLDQVGVLAQVFAVLRAGGLNVQQVQNQIFSGAAAAVATVHVDGTTTEALLDQLRAIPEVLGAAITPSDPDQPAN